MANHDQDPQGFATIKVKTATQDRVKLLKGTLKPMGVKSQDGVIKWLLDNVPEEDELGSGSEDEVLQPQRKRKNNVGEPFLSYQEMAARNGMLKYYTGLEKSAIDMLIERLRVAVMSLFFSFFSFWIPNFFLLASYIIFFVFSGTKATVWSQDVVAGVTLAFGSLTWRSES